MHLTLINTPFIATLKEECKREQVTVTQGEYGSFFFHIHRGQKNFFFIFCRSLIPLTRANAQWVFHGLHIAL